MPKSTSTTIKTRGRPPYNKVAECQTPLESSTDATVPSKRRSTRRKIAVKKQGVPIEEPTAKKEPTIKKEKKEPKAKKEPEPKKEPKPTRIKKQPFKLPPEATIYLDSGMRGRVLRAMKQKMFVLSRDLDSSNDSIERFEVLGSIGNSYTVTIGDQVTCSCMDYRIRRTHCKHILMIFLKVYRLGLDSPMFQRLRASREERINARSHGRIVDPSVLVPNEIRQRILKYTHSSHPDIEQPKGVERRPLDTSDCPICFEEFEQENIANILYCQVCGNNVHDNCFNMWKQSKGNHVTCVYCRSEWISLEDTPQKRQMYMYHPDLIHEGRPNFAKELGLSRKRDTSTYKSNGRYNF